MAAKRFAEWAAAQTEGSQTLKAWRDVLLETLKPVDYLALAKHFLELQVLAKSEAVRTPQMRNPNSRRRSLIAIFQPQPCLHEPQSRSKTSSSNEP